MAMVLAVSARSQQTAISSVVGPIRNPGPLMTALAADLERAVRRNFQEGGRPVRWAQSRRAAYRGGKTLIEHGLLLNSIFRRNTGTSATVFTRDRRAKIHEFGGVILPVNAKALTIPIHRLAEGKRASDFPDLFVIKGKDGRTGILAMRDDKKLVLLFVLRKSVRIPARPYIEPPEVEIAFMTRRVGNYVAGKPQ